MRGAALILLLIAPLGAQHVISAMAGYIHHIEGEASLEGRRVESKPRDLNHVLAGQTLRTEAGYAEILLTPRSFFRLGHDSEMEMVDGGLTAARIRLKSGSAVVDLPVLFDADSIVVILDGTEVRLNKPGRYALTAAPAEVTVLAGRVDLESAGESIAVRGRRRWTRGEDPEKLKSEPSSELLDWSRRRQTKLDEVLAEARKGKDIEGMDPAFRQWLEMTMRRPSPPPQPSAPRTPVPTRNR